jgi:IclR family transcriptional regulator, KDG regulon repressor
MNKKQISYDAPAVRNAVCVIELLCESEQSLGVTELKQALGINNNMLFRILCVLQELGWVVRESDPPKYRMSLRAFHYVSQPVARMNLQTAAREPLWKLWKETGESCYLSVLDDDRVLHLEHLDAIGSIKIASRAGARYLLHCSAPGKALLAYAGQDLFKRLARKGFARNSDQTITEPELLQRNLEEVRRQGYALDVEEYARGVMCFAVPIRNYTRKMIGAVGLSVLTLNYSLKEMIDRLGPKVLKTGREISLQLGMVDGGQNSSENSGDACDH